jgi:hypothetical protein
VIAEQRGEAMRRKLAFVVAVLGAALSPALLAISVAADNWLTYHNDRFGTTIDYPDRFKAEPEPANDDGRKFTSADGAEFVVYGSLNVDELNLAQFQDFALKNLDPGHVVTYNAHGENWFVISGTNGAKIFYERHLLSHRGELTENFSIEYPAAAKEDYDAIIARMAKSLRPGKGFQLR